MLEFQKEIIEFISKKHIKSDDLFTYDIWSYSRCCAICLHIILTYKYKLPSNLHNRIILGEQNLYTKEYTSKL